MMSAEYGEDVDVDDWNDDPQYLDLGDGDEAEVHALLNVDDAISLDSMSDIGSPSARSPLSSIYLDSSFDQSVSWESSILSDQLLAYSNAGSQYSSINSLMGVNMDDIEDPRSPISVSSQSTVNFEISSPRSEASIDPDNTENDEGEPASDDEEDPLIENEREIVHLVNDTDNTVEIPSRIELPSQPDANPEVTIGPVPIEEPFPSCSREQPKEASVGVKRSADFDNEDDDDDGQTCMICMDIWSNSGDHRLSSLRCGHLFGYSCIVRWLQVARHKPLKKCPQCNKSAAVKDVRILYAKKLIALDTIERDNIKKRLTEVERERNKLELELKKCELTTQLQDRQLTDLRKKLVEVQSAQVRGYGINHPPTILTQTKGTGEINLILEHSVEICKEGGCRVLAYKESLNLVVVSQKSANQLFSGYGISKMNSLNFRPTQFVFLHTKPIRDLAFHTSDNDLLLSVSFDRCAKLLDISSNNVVQSFQTDSPLWSCNWDLNNSNIFYVGSANGTVLEYDMRQTGGPINRIECDDKTPVTGLIPMPSNPGGALPRGGFVSCHLNSCWAYDRTRHEFNGKQLPLEGPFFAMRYDRVTDHFLVSSRPSTSSLRVRHVVCELDLDPSTRSLACNPIQTFSGSTSQTILSRPCQMTIREYGSVVASHIESSNSIGVWNMANGARVCNQVAREPILDICPIYVNDKQYLGTISEKMFRAYRVTT